MKINCSKDLRKACNLVCLGKTKTGEKEKAQKTIPSNYILESLNIKKVLITLLIPQDISFLPF